MKANLFYANGTERTNQTFENALATFMEHSTTFQQHGIRTIWKLNPNTDNWKGVEHTVINRFELGGYEWVIVDVEQFTPSMGFQIKREALYQPAI